MSAIPAIFFFFHNLIIIHNPWICQVNVHILWYIKIMGSFAEKLKEIRVLSGYSQKEASLLLGLSKHAFYNYEKGIREPSFETLIKICKLFDVSADYLLGLED